MLSRNQIKHLASLRLKKFREESGQFIAEGHKLVMDLVNSHFTLQGIYACKDWIDQNSHRVSAKKIPVFETTVAEMERITSLSTASPVLAVVAIPHEPNPQDVQPLRWEGFILALDDIRDPGNMGTIIRIADWFGISTILCSENCVDIYNPKVVQATMGSIARVRVSSCDLLQTLINFTSSGGSVYGAFLEGESIYQMEPITNGIILIGNESRGVSPLLEPLVTHKIFIPAHGGFDSGKAESLNASVATAIICAEFRRKENIPG